jgi:outer membrane protein OmpA-like peptidoglycan-associated protein
MNLVKPLLVAVLSLCVGAASFAQDDKNLVTNPSFESVKGKLKKQKQIAYATNWESPTGLAADLFSASVKEIVSVPKNTYGNEQALEGENYAGIVAFSYNNKEPRTYLQTELLGPLKKGTQYCVKFNVALADKSKYSANNLGAYVTQKRFEVEGKSDIIFDEPKEKAKVVKHPENNTYDARYGWETVCNVFTAEGKERFLIIGNFYNTKDTRYKKLKKPKDLIGQQKAVAYYYIDQVELFVLDSIEECDCIKGGDGENIERVIYHKQITSEAKLTPDQKINNSTIYFDWVSPKIDPSMIADLDSLAALLNSDAGAGISLECVGHYGDQENSEIAKNDYYKGLDKKRAQAVVDYLVAKGVASDRLTMSNQMANSPAREGTEEVQRAQNRRVEFKIK